MMRPYYIWAQAVRLGNIRVPAGKHARTTVCCNGSLVLVPSTRAEYSCTRCRYDMMCRPASNQEVQRSISIGRRSKWSDLNMNYTDSREYLMYKVRST